MGTLINIVGIRCKPNTEKKYVDWLTGTHIPLLLKFRGLKKVTHTKLITPDDGYPQYLNMFEFDSEKAFLDYEKSPELAAAMAELHETWKTDGFQRLWRVQYETLKSWSR